MHGQLNLQLRPTHYSTRRHLTLCIFSKCVHSTGRWWFDPSAVQNFHARIPSWYMANVVRYALVSVHPQTCNVLLPRYWQNMLYLAAFVVGKRISRLNVNSSISVYTNSIAAGCQSPRRFLGRSSGLLTYSRDKCRALLPGRHDSWLLSRQDPRYSGPSFTFIWLVQFKSQSALYKIIMSFYIEVYTLGSARMYLMWIVQHLHYILTDMHMELCWSAPTPYRVGAVLEGSSGGGGPTPQRYLKPGHHGGKVAVNLL